MTTSPFILSIEPTDGPAFRHGYHLGTIEAVARQEAEARFNGRNAFGLHQSLAREGYEAAWREKQRLH